MPLQAVDIVEPIACKGHAGRDRTLARELPYPAVATRFSCQAIGSPPHRGDRSERSPDRGVRSRGTRAGQHGAGGMDGGLGNPGTRPWVGARLPPPSRRVARRRCSGRCMGHPAGAMLGLRAHICLALKRRREFRLRETPRGPASCWQRWVPRIATLLARKWAIGPALD